MRTVLIPLQILAALGLLNVWLLRFNRATTYRGGDASSMVEEFAAYRLPAWFAYAIGMLKVGSALALIAGIWFPAAVFPAAALVCVLMLGALGMHARIRDPLRKSLPALAMLVLCVCICWISIA
jgi:type IV secretory pathway VirB6-like protein